jgi:hypothetical protein
VLIRVFELLRAFFLTEKEFKFKEEVKKSVDLNILLSLSSSDDEQVVSAAGWLLYDIYAWYSSPSDEGEEHPDFQEMEKNGMMEKMCERFMSCKNDKGKRLLGLTFLAIHRTKEFCPKHIEIMKWIRDNTNESTDSLLLRNTLVEFRLVAFSLIFIFIDFRWCSC